MSLLAAGAANAPPTLGEADTLGVLDAFVDDASDATDATDTGIWGGVPYSRSAECRPQTSKPRSRTPANWQTETETGNHSTACPAARWRIQEPHG